VRAEPEGVLAPVLELSSPFAPGAAPGDARAPGAAEGEAHA
jgi:hypothetical protein